MKRSSGKRTTGLRGILALTGLALSIYAVRQWNLNQALARELDRSSREIAGGTSPRLESIRKLLRQGASLSTRSPNGETALSVAAGAHDTALVQEFLARGAEIEAEDRRRLTPLMTAALSGPDDEGEETVQALLDHGAKVDHPTDDGHTALMWAAFSGKTEVVELLLSHGASVNHQNGAGRTALMLSALYGQPLVVKVLLRQGADPNLRSTTGITALMWAIQSSQLESTKALLARGADPNARDRRGQTVMRRALLTMKQHNKSTRRNRQSRASREIVALLYQAGARE